MKTKITDIDEFIRLVRTEPENVFIPCSSYNDGDQNCDVDMEREDWDEWFNDSEKYHITPDKEECKFDHEYLKITDGQCGTIQFIINYCPNCGDKL